MAPIYNHVYLPISVYGNVVSLLKDHVKRPGMHIDIGCGYGAIAEPIRDEVGLAYTGFDQANDGLKSLSSRGFETHSIDLNDLSEADLCVREASRGRQIRSVTFLDTLEHIVNGPEVVAWLRSLCEETSATLVVSVPNASHKDVAMKLLAGRWDVTEAGLLDHTHVECYTERRLKRLMAQSGFREIAAKDWLLETSDQRFPESFLLHDPTLPIGSFQRQLVARSNPHFLVNQFVRAYEPCEPLPVGLLSNREEPVGPLFSIILASEVSCHERLDSLNRNLADQTCQDFQLILTNNSPTAGLTPETLPLSIRSKATIVSSRGAPREEALNEALLHSDGRHVIILPDDAIVTADWLSSFAELAAQKPRSVLRVGNREASATADPLRALLSLRLGPTPSVAEFAIPAGVFHHLGFKFDQGGDAFAMIERAIMFCGVVASTKGTVIQNKLQQIFLLRGADAGLDREPLLLPAGSASRIAQLLEIKSALHLNARLYDRFSGAGHERRSSNSESPCAESDGQHPFLSVITRTTGRRLTTLREALMSLAGQTSQNFEVHLVVHSASSSDVSAVESLVAEFPKSMTSRIKILQCLRQGRAAPLNDAIDCLRGRYVCVLDDDDFVFAHWVATFETLALANPGSLLRATCVRQYYEITADGDRRISRATSWFKCDWPSVYDAVTHIYKNKTPFMSVAFPVQVFTELRLRFDESLTTLEDWQLMTQAAMHYGVASSPEITSVYRWWTNGESSLRIHTPEEWKANLDYVVNKLDNQLLLLPPGSAARICELIDNELKKKKNRPIEMFFKQLVRPKNDKPKKKKKRPIRKFFEQFGNSIRKRANRITTIARFRLPASGAKGRIR